MSLGIIKLGSQVGVFSECLYTPSKSTRAHFAELVMSIMELAARLNVGAAYLFAIAHVSGSQ